MEQECKYTLNLGTFEISLPTKPGFWFRPETDNETKNGCNFRPDTETNQNH